MVEQTDDAAPVSGQPGRPVSPGRGLLRHRRTKSTEDEPARAESGDPRSAGLSWLQTVFQRLAVSAPEIRNWSPHREQWNRDWDPGIGEIIQRQTDQISAAWAARRERLQAFQARVQSELAQKWHHSMETPVDLSIVPPLHYIWDELKHALLILALSGLMLLYSPRQFLWGIVISVNVGYAIWRCKHSPLRAETGYRMYLSDSPRISFNPVNPKSVAILSKCTVLYRRFYPTVWAFGAKVQTAMFALWPFPVWLLRGRVEYQRELIKFPDGGSCALDWLMTPSLADDSMFGTVVHQPGASRPDILNAPIVVVLSGVVGQVSNLYVKRIVMYIHKAHPGWRIVVKSWRGIGVKLTSPRPETWGPQAVEDLHCCVTSIQARYPDAPLLGVGFSFGGSILTSYMGVHADEDAFTAGVSISSMFELNTCMALVEGTIYDWLNTSYLLTHLQNDLPWIASGVGNKEQLADLSGVAGIRTYHKEVAGLSWALSLRQVTTHWMKQDGQLEDDAQVDQLIDHMTTYSLEACKQAGRLAELS